MMVAMPITIDDDDDDEPEMLVLATSTAVPRSMKYEVQSHVQLVLGHVEKDDKLEHARANSRKWFRKCENLQNQITTLVAKAKLDKEKRDEKSELAICYIGTKERSECRTLQDMDLCM